MRRLPVMAGLLACLQYVSAFAVPPANVAKSDGPGNTLRFASTFLHNTTDPQRASWSHDFRIIEQMYEPLLRLNTKTFALEPAAAKKWEVSDDRLTYTFHLRKDAKWSNGDLVTTHDFRYAWMRAILPDTVSDYGFTLIQSIDGAKDLNEARDKAVDDFAVRARFAQPQKQKELAQEMAAMYDRTVKQFDQTVGIAAPNDHTLVVRLAKPLPQFAHFLAFPVTAPVHRKTYEKHRRFDPETGAVDWAAVCHNDPETTVTNGPFCLESYEVGKKLVMKTNKHYWDHKATDLARVEEFIVEGEGERARLYDAGEIDWIPVIFSSAKAFMQAKFPADFQSETMAGTYYLEFNCRDKLPDGSDNPLRDQRVRQALSITIPRKVIAEKIRKNVPPTMHFIPQGVMGGYPSPKHPHADADADTAKALLKAAGFPNGRGLDGLSVSFNTGSDHERILEAIAMQWKGTLGVEVQLIGMETRRFADAKGAGRFSIARAGWFGDFPDPVTFLDVVRQRVAYNNSGFSNKEFEKVMEDAAAATSSNERMKLLSQAEAIVLRDCPVAPIYHYTNADVVRKGKVLNLHLNPWAKLRLKNVRIADDGKPGK